jgi:hypothetical protein
MKQKNNILSKKSELANERAREIPQENKIIKVRHRSCRVKVLVFFFSFRHPRFVVVVGSSS